MTAELDRIRSLHAAGQVACEPHHWVSTNVPGLLARWVIQCSLCGAYNVEEMNAALSAAGFGPVQEARAEALEEAADWLDNADQCQNIAFEGPSDLGQLIAKYEEALEEPAEWLRARAVAERGRQ